jgi:anti-sigma regulatory factor (Ser/Thr protein kinase)
VFGAEGITMTRLGEGADVQHAPPGFDLRLTVDAEPNALAVVRHAVGGAASALGLDPAAVADIRLALTEVCSAALRRGEAGDPSRPPAPLDVTAHAHEGTLRIVVRDRAPGAPSGPGDALPLPLVAAITETVELRRARGGGTEVAMTFAFDQHAS